MLAKLMASPRPHLIVDNFLPRRVLAKSRSEVGAEAYAYEIEYRGAGRIEFTPLKSKTLWRAVYSRRTVGLLSPAFWSDGKTQ
jgi:hypothetical protein